MFCVAIDLLLTLAIALVVKVLLAENIKLRSRLNSIERRLTTVKDSRPIDTLNGILTVYRDGEEQSVRAKFSTKRKRY